MKNKTILLLSLIILVVGGCTQNQRAKHWGGTLKIDLPKGQKLTVATWKDASLWYLTEPMDSSYHPIQKTFIEDANWGFYNGTVIFTESK